MRRRLIAWRPWGLASALSASLLLALVIAACGGDDDDAGSPSGDGGDGTETVEIGLLISQSGVAAASVRSAIDAVELAVMQINEEGFTVGDKRYKFNLNIVDDKSDPNSAVAAATELVEDKGVKFVFGPVTSSLAPPVAQFLGPKKVLMLSPASALDQFLDEEKLAGPSKTIFKTNYSGESFVKIYGEGVRALFPDAKTVAILHANDQTGVSTADYYEKGVTEAGMEVVARESFPIDASDFSTLLTKIKGSDPDVLIVIYLEQHVTAVMKQAEELGIRAGIVSGNHGLPHAIERATGKPLIAEVGVIYQPVVLEELPDGTVQTNRPGVDKYLEDLRSLLGREPAPGTTGFYFYDWVFLLRDAMVEAGTVSDTEKIAEALETVEREGVIGPTRFVNHASVADADVCKVVNGEVTCQIVDNPVR